jgi:hypothetical protein
MQIQTEVFVVDDRFYARVLTRLYEHELTRWDGLVRSAPRII